ncbi:homeobox-leucine zipper protein HDG11-like [Solanum stenotomum]|uniref:homeobox-leucine zipper protein HDG11-like n=1 Tax=Solanum stenotomum TaxID=172797 RepID=UPI0020D0B783|nr:homeobox-leucine zipper protein HDG11-like [Solanum stenotomum]
MTDSGKKQVEESSTSPKSQRHCHKYNVEKTQQLEEFFKKCQRPSEDQQNQLGRKVGLDPKQIMIWFQNKRAQTKAKDEESDNHTLRKENEFFRCEIMAMKEKKKNNMCPQCDGPSIGEEQRMRNLENLKMESQRMREEHLRISRIISSSRGISFGMDSNLAPLSSTLGSLPDSSNDCLLSQIICGSPIGYNPPFDQEKNYNEDNNVRAQLINNNNIPIMSSLPQENYGIHHDNREKSIFDIVDAAMKEMLVLLDVNDPVWVKSSGNERCCIHRESYDRKFPNSYRPYKSSTTRIESSKHFGVVPMTAIELIPIFLDPNKWMNMFPTIVRKARNIDVINPGNIEGSIQLMYEQLHILSPSVEAREFFIIRCCRKLDQTTWIILDVSYDLFKEIQTHVPSYAWKFPSGCAIQDMANGGSMITWIEHVQVDEKNHFNGIFKDMLCGHKTYGAERWIVTLQRMSERYNFAMGATCPTKHDLKGVVYDIPKEVKNLMNLSQRMVKSFCEILNMTDKLDFPTSSQLNNGDRVSIRKNIEITEQQGFIASAATSLWLPLSFETIFNFLKDDNTRCQWDVLCGENNVIEKDKVQTGTSLENNITIIQPYMPIENNMLVLQESNIDDMGAFLIYGTIDISTYNSIVNGSDAKEIAILPSGIMISHDGRLCSNRNNNENVQNGSILTVALQKLICADDHLISQHQQMETVTYIHNLLSSIVLKIKAALCYSD